MSRKVDQLPARINVRPMKVIVASPSRSGTLGLYQAMGILGYNTYHMYECITAHDVPHMELFREAITAQYNGLSGIKKYMRPDFERWLGDYDCLVEIPSYVGMDLIEAYIDDSDVKFILTERNPEKWATSVNNTVAPVHDMPHQFPFNILKYFDSRLHSFLNINEVVYRALSRGTKPSEPDNSSNLQKHYIDYVKKAKETIPADRLCVIQLENGLGWKDICPFLNLPIPEQPYPERNEPEKFQKIVQDWIQPRIALAAMRFSALAIPVVGIMGWAALRYGSMDAVLRQLPYRR